MLLKGQRRKPPVPADVVTTQIQAMMIYQQSAQQINYGLNYSMIHWTASLTSSPAPNPTPTRPLNRTRKPLDGFLVRFSGLASIVADKPGSY
jgi:hypothetical protein